jgi:hypothetical protein
MFLGDKVHHNNKASCREKESVSVVIIFGPGRLLSLPSGMYQPWCSVTRATPSAQPKGETMSDKKVGRFGGRPITPTEQMERALSDPGTVNVSDLPHDKGRGAVADKFREREERWRRDQADQALQDQRVAFPTEPAEQPVAEAGETRAGDTAKGDEGGEGGER